ncbi:DUF2306 domain-containing protein [Nonomuraea sp. RK-328]|nr:DUF2306 domain-containing protein [Nonomuraea sp. RK-328]
MGRVYFFLGVFPAGIAVLGVAPFGHTGFGGNTGNTMLGVVWLLTGLAGWRMAWQRRFPEHRRWMIRSFALTTSIVASRAWAGVLFAVQLPVLDSAYGGDQQAMIEAIGSAGVWLRPNWRRPGWSATRSSGGAVHVSERDRRPARPGVRS